MLTKQQMDEIKSRALQPAFASVIKRLEDDVSWTFDRALPFPDRSAGYYHEYFCPDHAVQLEYDPDSPYRHRCPADGAWFSGEPYDSAWLWSVNHELAEAAFRLALLSQVSTESKYENKAKSVLLGYSERYLGYDHDDDRPIKGKLTWSCLDESVWIIPMSWATWFLRETLSSSDLTAIRENLLIPAAEHLIQQRQERIHNIENWLNAAIGTIGIVTENDEIAELVLSGPYGFHDQVAQGVLADGAWYEGSPSYHFYSLAPLIWHARATEGTETDLRSAPQIRSMLAAPFQWAYPNLTLPAFNDCWYHTSLLDECGHGIPSSAGFYEIGAAWYSEPLFRAVLQRTYKKRSRDTVEALLYGLAPLSTDDLAAPESIHLAPSGYAILRNWGNRLQEQELPYLLLKYGRHGGTHGHPDKLSMVLAMDEQHLSPDLGTAGYGIGLNESWYRHTVSHNTVLLDQTAQPPGRGELLSFLAPEDGPFGVADAAITWGDPGPYGDSRFRRVFLVGQGYFLDLFLVERTASGDIDWVYHNRGDLEGDFTEDSIIPDLDEDLGYGHLTATQERAEAGQTILTFAGNNWGLQLSLAGGPATQIMLARGPDNPASETMPVVIRRRQAKDTCFAALFHPYRGEPIVKRVTWFPSHHIDCPPVACLVERGHTRDLWLLATSPGTELAPSDRPSADRIFTYQVEKARFDG